MRIIPRGSPSVGPGVVVGSVGGEVVVGSVGVVDSAFTVTMTVSAKLFPASS